MLTHVCSTNAAVTSTGRSCNNDIPPLSSAAIPFCRVPALSATRCMFKWSRKYCIATRLMPCEAGSGSHGVVWCGVLCCGVVCCVVVCCVVLCCVVLCCVVLCCAVLWAHLDWPPNALEVLRHVQGQDDILLQNSLGLCQASNIIPGHPRACIQHVPVRIMKQLSVSGDPITACCIVHKYYVSIEHKSCGCILNPTACICRVIAIVRSTLCETSSARTLVCHVRLGDSLIGIEAQLGPGP